MNIRYKIKNIEYYGQAISQNSSKPLIIKWFYLLRISNDCCFHRSAHGQLSQRNRRNTATVLRVVVKSHEGLKGTKVFACGCSGRNLKNFSTFAGENLGRSPFTLKLQPAIQIQSKDYSIYTETPTQVLSVNFENIMKTTFNTSARLPLK